MNGYHHESRVVTANDLQIACELYGPEDAPAILLVHGLGMPLSGWPPAFVEKFLGDGYRVVMFDNRDIGKSQHLSHVRARNAGWELLRSRVGLKVRSPYILRDMMQDAVGVLDQLQIDSAHVVGASMGGMISQLLAIHAGERVRSLTSIMSTTGRRGLPGPSKDIGRHILSRPRNASVQETLEHGVRTWELIGSPAYRKDRAEIEEFLMNLYQRGVTPEGVTRQMLAILASPPRHESLRQLSIPSLVIHGDQDPLVPLACGEDTANSIPESTLHIYPGMGHDLPDDLLPDMAQRISRHAAEADGKRADNRAA